MSGTTEWFLREDRLTVWQGETVRASVAFSDASGAPMAATGVRIRARRPDGESVEGVVAPGATPDAFSADFGGGPDDPAGVWFVRAECSGPSAAAVEDAFEVVASNVL